MKNLKRSAWAGSLAAAVIIVVVTLMQLTAASALAQALEKVRDVQSVRYKQSLTMPDPINPQKTKTVESTVTVVEPAWISTEMPEMTIIFDYKAGKGLTLEPKGKSAIRMDIQNVPKEQQQENALTKLRKVDEKQARDLGEQEINGRKARVYQYGKAEDGGTLGMKIWIDTETRLPVRMEMGGQLGMLPKMQTVCTDFQWDVKVDKALLNLEVPKGYQVTDMAVNVAPPAEADLLAALKTAAELDGGKFPDTFSMMGFMQSFKTRFGDLKNPDAKIRNQAAEQMAVMMRGMRFLGTPNVGSDWHYAGKDAKLGDATRPIFWYRPQGKETYRVIDGALQVKEVPPAELPKVNSVPVDPAKLMVSPGIPPRNTQNVRQKTTTDQGQPRKNMPGPTTGPGARSSNDQ